MRNPDALAGLIGHSAFDAIASRVRGRLIAPKDPDFDAARTVWNGAIDRRPALIVRCAGAADVIECVRLAREHDLVVAVRGGGHNVAGTAVCDGGLVIDLSGLKGIRIDPRSRLAQAQPGLLWGEYDRETQAFGLATPGGIVTHTGVAGLTLGGGIGWLMRRHGLTSDQLVAADVVTADGELVRASDEDDPDLLWALRGGGGNFGVVTSFEFRLHSVGPTVLGGPVVFAAEEAADVLRFYRAFVENAPDELATIVNLRNAPPAPWLPDELHGRPVVMVSVCYVGPIDEGERAVGPLRLFGRPLVDLVEPKPYLANQSFFDASVPHGWGYYWKSHYLPPLTDEVIDVLVGHAWTHGSPTSYTIMFHMGGEVRRRDPDSCAFEDRRAEHAVNINAVWRDPRDSDSQIAWARAQWDALVPHATGGVYVNFLGDEGERRVHAAYGPAKYERLAALKSTYDPTNLFRVNQNVRPLTAAGAPTRRAGGDDPVS